MSNMRSVLRLQRKPRDVVINIQENPALRAGVTNVVHYASVIILMSRKRQKVGNGGHFIKVSIHF